ncbi:ATPase domain-containing protein [Ktedonospora formicarum]|uniref:Serine/threonine protein kinase n=1 Tax=Ktedonospora formicarum TaxID=2778364 RepID=A0A8J3MV84_9CHLR|nr:ATPase domain-containing protein [Ktedonospora formicarum]GHO46250.1 serine/threonine protein kinase [Ktedonospora formicarum]
MNTPSSHDDQASLLPRQGKVELTGVPQLDLVLGGGLPRGALVIILGAPGSGKTTLASQIAFAAAQRGEQALLLTSLSEPTTKLLSHLQSYSFFKPELVGNGVQVFSLQQFIAQGKPPIAKDIVNAVRQTQANLVVLDGFQGIRSLEPDFNASRQLLYDLGTRLSLLGTTTIITTEADPRDPNLFPEMTTGDTLIGLYFTLSGVRAYRSLEVLKVRGRAPLPGRHSLALSAHGVHVYPRLETWSRYVPTNQLGRQTTPLKHKRATFSLPELDVLLGGGITRQTSTLLTGSLGVGKTLLSLKFALSGIEHGEPALFLGFRETQEQLLQKADSFSLGAQMRSALASGKLTLQRWEPVEVDSDQVATEMLNSLERTGARRVVIDSIAELERAVVESSGSERIANYLAALLAVFRARGVTLLAIKESSKIVTTSMDFSADTLSVLAENVLLVQQMMSHNKLHRVLSVLKMRFSTHEHSLREFVIAPPDGIRVLTKEESTLDGLLGNDGAEHGAQHAPHQYDNPSERGRG